MTEADLFLTREDAKTLGPRRAECEVLCGMAALHEALAPLERICAGLMGERVRFVTQEEVKDDVTRAACTMGNFLADLQMLCGAAGLEYEDVPQMAAHMAAVRLRALHQEAMRERRRTETPEPRPRDLEAEFAQNGFARLDGLKGEE